MRDWTNLILIFAIALLALGCGKAQDQQQQNVLEIGQFAPYVQEFEAQSAIHGNAIQVTNLVIRFGAMQASNERGECDIADGQPPTITLDQDYWNNVDEGARQSLIYHEIGHCVLRRLHLFKITDSGIPSSLMSPYTIDGVTYDRNQQYYWDELFSKRGQF